ncbi:MAG: hypothetical protein NTY70_04540 [Burkholderiales bacterium]|nr:hypothetical protein [Burkholderiales bacterium]
MTSPFSNTDNPAMAAMSDPLNFVKNLWGGMHVPGMVTPTVSIDELDKKITDLKTVESWLNVNMTMLKGSIQALEVQRATISTLKAMGESFAEQMNQAKSGATAASSETKTSNQTWPMHAASAAPKTEAPAASKPEASQPETAKATASATSKPAPEASSASGFGNPATMWNLLQDQFKQAVSKVMEGEQAASAMAKAATAGVMGNAAAGNSGAQAPVTAAAKTSAKAAPKAAQKTTAGTASKAAPKAKAAPKKTAKVAKPPAA